MFFADWWRPVGREELKYLYVETAADGDPSPQQIVVISTLQTSQRGAGVLGSLVSKSVGTVTWFLRYKHLYANISRCRVPFRVHQRKI